MVQFVYCEMDECNIISLQPFPKFLCAYVKKYVNMASFAKIILFKPQLFNN